MCDDILKCCTILESKIGIMGIMWEVKWVTLNFALNLSIQVC
jgi:hypothetical protein